MILENSYTEQFEALVVGFLGELVPLAVKFFVLDLTGTVFTQETLGIRIKKRHCLN
jgi:hypothetical protein